MQCEQIQSQLMAYLFGTLPQQERAAIEAHLMQCEACSEEANAMRDIGDRLSQGLKEWVNQGVCPPEVAARIQASLRSEIRRSTWRRTAAVLASVAAVAAVVLIAASARLLDPDLEIHLNPEERMTGALFRKSVDGLRLTIISVATSESATRIDYTVEGEGLVLPAEEAALRPQVSTPSGPLTCPSLTVDQQRGAIRFELHCEPVPKGETITLTLPELPRRSGGTFPSITATFTN
nr:MAG: hypothetical protein DIU55_08175 [Bacillota bacterium]